MQRNPFRQKRKAYKIVSIIDTIMESKKNQILKIFFENPTKEWHFEEILKEGKITRSKADNWLKQFIKEGLIKKIKEKGRFPHYIADYQSPSYQNKKKLFGLNQIYESGFLNHLTSLKQAKTVILFGSFARSDWYDKSDIDIFIYGDSQGLKTAKFEMKLHHDIQIFACHDKEGLNKLGIELIRNIIKGNIIKGDLDFIKVKINA